MEDAKDKIIEKYKELAKRYKRNAIVSHVDLKRHDRITDSEAKVMLRAEKDGLSIAKIGMIFDRSPTALSDAIERIKEAQLPPGLKPLIKVAEVTVTPIGRGSTASLQPYYGFEYLDILVGSNDLWIDNIIITTSHPKSSYTFLIFDSEQPPDGYNDWDVFWKETVSIRRTKYITPQPQLYHDVDGCEHLHCAFEHEGHPIRFDLNNQQLSDYFSQPVTFTVKLEYKLLQ